MSIFERTKEVAKSKGLNLRQLESKAGLSERSIYNWKSHNPNNQSLIAVANVLGVSTDYLLGNTDEMIPNKKDRSITNLDDKDTVFAFNGKPLPDEYKKMILAMLNSMEESNGDK